MQITNFVKCAVLGVALGGGAFSALALPQDPSQQQTTDPLADAARKAREEKKNAAKPKKVLTEDDIANRASDKAQDSSANQSSSSGSTGGQSTTATSAGQSSTEADWRKRFKIARDKISAAERQLDVMQREFEKAQIQYYPDPQKALMEQNNRQEINDRAAKIEAQKVQIKKLKQDLSDLEDDLRKSGGEPGWARE
jgi:hypothetical protein